MIRKIQCLLILFVSILFNFSIYANQNESKTDIDKAPIVALLKKADAAKQSLRFDCDYGKIIGKVDGASVALVTGQNSQFDNIMNILGKYYSKNAVILELQKIGIYIVNNKIGQIMASGEEFFTINENSKFEFIENGSRKMLIKILMLGEHGTPKFFYYTLCLINNKWIIDDEVDELNMYFLRDNPVSIRSSSTLFERKGSYKTYWPGNVIDNNPATAWVEGEKGNGIGEWIDFAFFNPINLNTIRIINGYAKSDALYAANNRVKKLKIDFDDGTLLVAELKDGTMEPQLIQISNQKVVERVRLTILEVYPGSQYHDTCISEIGFQ